MLGLQDLKTKVYEVTHAVNSNITKADADRAVKCVIEAIETELKEDGSVIFPGFGSFSVVERKAREGRNPQTGEAMTIEAHKTVKFKPGKNLKEAVQ